MTRILCLWLPHWPIQRLRAGQVGDDRPLVLLESRHGAERVAACSAAARKRGVRPGMARAEGEVLLESVPRSAFLPYDPTADRAALEALLPWASRFSPLAGIEQSERPECLLLDLGGVAHLFGGERSLAERFARLWPQRGLHARLAVADTLAAAWAVAHYGPADRPSAPRPSLAVPLFLVPPGAQMAAVRPLPVAALRLPEETLDLLRQLGIERVEQLARLPRDELPSRLGPLPALRLDQLAGCAAEPICAFEAASALSAEHRFEYPTRTRETLEAVLEQLCGQLAARLRESGRGAIRLECRIACGPAASERLSLGLFDPSASARHLFQLLRMQFERLRLPAPVTAASVAVTLSAPLRLRQRALFDDEGDRTAPHHLAALLDRLSTRLGRRAALGVRLHRDALPERAWRGDPLVGEPRRRRNVTATTTIIRPLRLLPRPMPLMVTSIQPGGPPVQFAYQGHNHRITHTWGPERIETGWWRGQMVGRDYYRVETAAGSRWWLFRRLRDGAWFLHGLFD